MSQTDDFATTDSTPRGEETKYKNMTTRPVYIAIR